MKQTDLQLINRTRPVFETDWLSNFDKIKRVVKDSRILIVGGAGSIGSSVSEIVFNMGAKCLHIIDINENALADLVRNLRSSSGYTTKDFLTICYDPLQDDSGVFINKNGPYDVILNFAAIKHVRSEKDAFTLSRMFYTNVKLMSRLVDWANQCNAHTLFSVSTDKAANPANLMGASKRLMEMTGFGLAPKIFSTARFANVAFSNGSLLNAFWDRLEKGQPFSSPSNIARFFITHEEAAKLCLLGAFIAPKGTISIPRVPGEIELTSFIDVATNVLKSRGLVPFICENEDAARSAIVPVGSWPCHFFESDTSGEKPYEEFLAESEDYIISPFSEIGVIGKLVLASRSDLIRIHEIDPISMSKEDIVSIIEKVIPKFSHVEKGKSLDQRM